MAANFSAKSIKFKYFSLHFLTFKNIDVIDFIELYDGVNDYLYKNKAAIINSVLTGNRGSERSIKKASKKVFEEVNWPLLWIGASKESNHSGSFLAISGVNVFTLVATDFITKILETPEARYAYVGEVLADSKEIKMQIEEVHRKLGYALEMAGLSIENTISSSYFIENTSSFYSDPTQFEEIALQESLFSAVGTKNQHQKRMMASFFAMRAKNDTIQIEKSYPQNEIFEAVVINYPKTRVLMTSSSLIRILEPIGIEETLESLERLITSYHFNWNNLLRAVAFISGAEDLAVFKKICKEKGIPMASVVTIMLDIKIQKIPFEIEAEFVITHEE